MKRAREKVEKRRKAPRPLVSLDPSPADAAQKRPRVARGKRPTPTINVSALFRQRCLPQKSADQLHRDTELAALEATAPPLRTRRVVRQRNADVDGEQSGLASSVSDSSLSESEPFGSSSSCSPSVVSSVSTASSSGREPKRRPRSGNRTATHSSNRQPLCLSMSPPETLLIVLDLDETVVFSRLGQIRLRPGVLQLLDACADVGAEVIVWTAASAAYANVVLQCIDHLIGQHQAEFPRLKPQRWFGQVISSAFPQTDPSQCAKDLSLLRADLRRVLLVDNSPMSASLQPQNCLLVEDFTGVEKVPAGHSKTLCRIAAIVRELGGRCGCGNAGGEPGADGNAVVDVPTYLSRCTGDVVPCPMQLDDGEVSTFFVLRGARTFGGVLRAVP